MAIFGEKTKEQKTAKKSTVSKTSVKEKSAKVATKDLYSATAASQSAVKAVESKKITNNRYYQTLIKPLVTEKASMVGVENKYIFAISQKANKIEVAKAIEAIYGIRPIKVNIINNQGKVVRIGRIQGKRKDWKKAVITLPKGKTIQVYEGV